MERFSDGNPLNGVRDAGEYVVQTLTEEHNCPTHGPYTARGRELLGRVIWTECPGCQEDRKRADEEARERVRQAQEEERRSRFMELSRIPLRYRGLRFCDYTADTDPKKRAHDACIQFVAEWDERKAKGEGLILLGGPGTGKTHLACSILEALYAKAWGRYFTAMDLIRAVRGTWRRDSEKSEEEVLNDFEGFSLLVVDELGVQYGTESEQNILFDVIDRRYRQMRPTILISNQNAEGLKSLIGDRAYDRLIQVGRAVSFNWPSYRPEARKAA